MTKGKIRVKSKDKKKVKLQQTMLKVKQARAESQYRQNWYYGTDSLSVSPEYALSTMLPHLHTISQKGAILETPDSIVNIFHSEKEIFARTYNRFYHKVFKSKPFFKEIIQKSRQMLSNTLIVPSTQLAQSVYLIFVSEEYRILHKLVQIDDALLSIPMSLIFSVATGYYYRWCEFLSLTEFMNFVIDSSVLNWNLKLNRLQGCCFIVYKNRTYVLSDFIKLIMIYITTYGLKTAISNNVIESDEVSKVVSKLFTDPDNVLYRSIESDLSIALMAKEDEKSRECVTALVNEGYLGFSELSRLKQNFDDLLSGGQSMIGSEMLLCEISFMINNLTDWVIAIKNGIA